MRRYRKWIIAAATFFVALAALPIYLWNAETTISEGCRAESSYKLSIYRFRPIAVLEFRSRSRNAFRLVKITYGATTILRVDYVLWSPYSDSVSIGLVSTPDSEASERAGRILIDFRRSIALTNLDGSMTDEQVRLTTR